MAEKDERQSEKYSRTSSRTRRVKKKSKTWIYVLIGIIGVIILAGLIGSGILYYMISKDLPDVNVLKGYVANASTQVYSDKGDLIGELFVEKRTPVPFDKIPEIIKKATIAVEDEHYYSHEGIDFLGIGRAVLANLRAAKISQGGSTITQQLAKTMFLSPEKTIKRKLKEAILAFKIEKNFSKEEILELYLNQIYYGQGVYGIEAAAMVYFGKHINQLILPEFAFIAGLPKAPSNYSPYTALTKAISRRNHVLNRMAINNFITAEEEKEAIKHPLRVKEKKKDDAPAYFLEYIRQELEQKFESSFIYRSGLSVYTTMNLNYQKAAFLALKKGLEALDKRQGYQGPIAHLRIDKPEEIKWEEVDDKFGIEDLKNKRKLLEDDKLNVGEILPAVVIKVDPQSLLVALGPEELGIIQIEDMKWVRKPNPNNDALYYELKHTEKFFKKGDLIKVSILKKIPLPILKKTSRAKHYLSLEQTPVAQGAILVIEPQTGFIKSMIGGYDFSRSQFNRAVQAIRQPGSSFKPIIYASALENGLTPASTIIDLPIVFAETNKAWKPENFSRKFYGPTTLRTALAYSRNVITIKLLQQMGIKKSIETARRLGINSPLAEDLTLALGSSGVTIKEMTSAYGVFANKGVLAEPMAIRYIKDRNGKKIEDYQPVKNQAISEEVSYIISNMMEDVVKYGTGKSVSVLNRPVAGKTGTTNNFNDAWFIGYTPNLVTSVWTGMDQEQSLGKNETGGRAAAPIWLKFMQEVLINVPITGFSPPPKIVFTKIDPQSGLLAYPETPGAYLECFIEGTEPTTYMPKQEISNKDFFSMDVE